MFRHIAYIGITSILPSFLSTAYHQRKAVWGYSPLTVLILTAAIGFTVAVGEASASDAADSLEPGSNEFKEPTGKITYGTAIEAVMNNSPILARYRSLMGVRAAELTQSKLLPNPEIEFEMEEFAGSGSLSGFDSVETTALFSQLIELGRKRAKRSRVAGLNERIAQWDYEAARVAVLSDVSKSFMEVLTTQEKVQILEDNLRMVHKLHSVVGKRIEYGETSSLEQGKIEAILTAESIKLERAKRDLEDARLSLASLWGSRAVAFDAVSGKLGAEDSMPTLDVLYEKLSESPLIVRWADEVSKHEEQIRLQRANAVPDVKVGGGVKHLNESGDVAGVVQFSFPLPLFNRNQGNIRKSRHELEAARAVQRESEVRIYTELSKRYNKLAGIRAEYKTIKTKLLPVSKRVYKGVLSAYESGQADYLEVIDAHRMHADSKLQYAQTLGAYNQAIIDVKSLLAVPEGTPPNQDE